MANNQLNNLDDSFSIPHSDDDDHYIDLDNHDDMMDSLHMSDLNDDSYNEGHTTRESISYDDDDDDDDEHHMNSLHMSD